MSDQISVRDLTTQLENGDSHNAPAFFKGKFEEDRFKDLDAIRQLNEQDRAAGKTGVTLDCEKSIYYNDNISISSTNGAWQEFWGGKQLYNDTLDLHTLKHSDPSDTVPATCHPVDVRKLTDAMEVGDGKAVAAALDGKHQEERISILEQASALNQADLAGHKTNVTLDVEVAGSKYNAATMSVMRMQPGAHDAWMGGVPIYNETLDLDTGKRQIQADIDGRK
jgi:hypothetical protein